MDQILLNDDVEAFRQLSTITHLDLIKSAVEANAVQIATFLLNAHHNAWETYLCRAIRIKDNVFAKWLIQHYPTYSENRFDTPLHYTVNYSNPEILEILLDYSTNKYLERMIMISIRKGDVDCFKILLVKYVPPHNWLNMDITTGCLNNIEMIKILSQRFAPLNEWTTLNLLYKLSDLPKTKLNLEVLEFILQSKFWNINKYLDGYTPLHRAITVGNVSSVMILLEYGAYPYILTEIPYYDTFGWSQPPENAIQMAERLADEDPERIAIKNILQNYEPKRVRLFEILANTLFVPDSLD